MDDVIAVKPEDETRLAEYYRAHCLSLSSSCSTPIIPHTGRDGKGECAQGLSTGTGDGHGGQGQEGVPISDLELWRVEDGNRECGRSALNGLERHGPPLILCLPAPILERVH